MTTYILSEKEKYNLKKKMKNEKGEWKNNRGLKN